MTDNISPGMPRWVKVFVLVVILLILLVGGFMLFWGGSHGPGRHAPGMLTGFALLADGHRPEIPALGGHIHPGDVILAEDCHK